MCTDFGDFPSLCSPKHLGVMENTNFNQEKMIRKGTNVKWSWGNGTAEGKVVETYTSKITKTIKGTEVTRNGNEDDKALFIKQDDGTYVLKSESEVDRVD